jgi:predicted acetyltransferase
MNGAGDVRGASAVFSSQGQMKIDIVPAATADFATVRNLFQLYAYDMSEFAGFVVGGEGLFAPSQSLWNYWNGEAGTGALHWPAEWRGLPFLVHADGNLAGFALVKQLASAAFDMGEFFVLRKYRRTGLGSHVARAMFDRFPGYWEIRQMPPNLAAQAFWRRLVSDYTGGRFEEGRAYHEFYRGEFVFQKFRSDRPQ